MWLAPLAGYTDQPFRLVCKDNGADIVVSEMVSADGIVHKQKNTLAYMKFITAERPFGIQLFGSNASIMAKATGTALTFEPDFIDINMGCPVKKVTKRGAGGALMSNLKNAVDITTAVRKEMPDSIPLCVKFRSGADMNNLNYLDFGQAIQDAGADLVTLHPRTVKQMFTGVSNWQHITELKKQLSIPVVGNGDVKNVADATELFSTSGCDAIMIGRGALGNPWIFKNIKNSFLGQPLAETGNGEKLHTLLTHIEYSLRVKPERRVVKEIRSHICHYTKGINGSAKLRNVINQTETINELKEVLTAAFSNL